MASSLHRTWPGSGWRPSIEVQQGWKREPGPGALSWAVLLLPLLLLAAWSLWMWLNPAIFPGSPPFMPCPNLRHIAFTAPHSRDAHSEQSPGRGHSRGWFHHKTPVWVKGVPASTSLLPSPILLGPVGPQLRLRPVPALGYPSVPVPQKKQGPLSLQFLKELWELCGFVCLKAPTGV